MHEFQKLFVDNDAPAGKVVRAIAAGGSVSASQLMKSTGLARSTVSTVLSDLKDRGVVTEVETRSTGFGRPTQLLSLNPTQGFCAGVLLGLGEIRIAICDLAHNIVSDVWFEMPRSYEPGEAAIHVRLHLEEQCGKLGITIPSLLGVGFAVSAPVSYEGQILNGSILPTWCGINIAEAFSSEIACAIYAENESHCGALAEMTWGAAVGEPNFVLFKFDLGIGGAVVVDGHVLRGAYGNAAEFGHISLNPHGPLCGCGNRGCLETYAGGFNLIRMAEQAFGEKLSAEAFLERVRHGDPACQRLVADAAEMAGWGMGIAATILSPPLILIAGKLAGLGDVFLQPLQKSFSRHTVQPPIQAPKVRNSRLVVGKFLGNDDTVLGAVALVLHQHGKVAERSQTA